ncbi:hypothetical protein [Flavihumibacter sp. UBA7668]|uniref:hypothetical protein n=1 Tax=Flavihumibacter sp. UBA7668 TaxID=1946542 RepID=UPI0025BC5ECD|nr:hypothetical protein [Flavihumibacter sp. UBA7668]
MPILALFSWPFGGPQHIEYGKHVISALYFLSFLMLAMVVYAKILDWMGSLTVVLGFIISTLLYRWVISWLTLHSI